MGDTVKKALIELLQKKKLYSSAKVKEAG